MSSKSNHWRTPRLRIPLDDLLLTLYTFSPFSANSAATPIYADSMLNELVSWGQCERKMWLCCIDLFGHWYCLPNTVVPWESCDWRQLEHIVVDCCIVLTVHTEYSTKQSVLKHTFPDCWLRFVWYISEVLEINLCVYFLSTFSNPTIRRSCDHAMSTSRQKVDLMIFLPLRHASLGALRLLWRLQQYIKSCMGIFLSSPMLDGEVPTRCIDARARAFEPSAVSVKWSRIIQRRESPKTIFADYSRRQLAQY